LVFKPDGNVTIQRESGRVYTGGNLEQRSPDGLLRGRHEVSDAPRIRARGTTNLHVPRRLEARLPPRPRQEGCVIAAIPNE
jgi:hypothetical protein